MLIPTMQFGRKGGKCKIAVLPIFWFRQNFDIWYYVWKYLYADELWSLLNGYITQFEYSRGIPIASDNLAGICEYGQLSTKL